MTAKRMLVTGAAGFIGSHLAERLVRDGAEVTALVHYNATRSLGNLEHVAPEVRDAMRVELGDIRDGEHMARLAEDQDVIFHLGALIAIPYSYVAPRSYVATNIEGTLNVLEAVRRGSAGRLVHTSTSEVYGSALYVPIDEKHPLQGQSPYSATKIGADKLVESYVRSFEVPAVTVRPFNTYGPRQSARAFIPTVIVQALQKGPVRLGALSPVRDLTFVTDTVAGFVAAGEADGVLGETFNLGVGEGWSMGEVARRILAAIDPALTVEEDPSRIRPAASEVDRLISQNARFRERTGWAPLVSLDEGLEKTIAFFRDRNMSTEAALYVV